MKIRPKSLAKGVPKLKGNAFYQCASCASGKLCTKRTYPNAEKKKTATKQTPMDNEEAIPPGEPGQHYHMDFGFVRGHDESFNLNQQLKKKKKGKIVQSIDGYNCYLIIVDRVTRYTWIFLSKNKQPPIETVRQLLTKFKSEIEKTLFKRFLR